MPKERRKRTREHEQRCQQGKLTLKTEGEILAHNVYSRGVVLQFVLCVYNIAMPRLKAMKETRRKRGICALQNNQLGFLLGTCEV